MWDNPIHRAAFVKARQCVLGLCPPARSADHPLRIRRDDFDQFIRFANMLMSDTTFHLDESLTGLAKIHSIKSDMASPEWSSRPENERKDLEAQLRQAEGATPFHTQLGRSHVQLLKEFTATTKEPFLTPEIVDRLAAVRDRPSSLHSSP
jgi:ubiquitin conjugation factor E4 B